MCNTQRDGAASAVRVLFLGNSATYVHDLPGTLGRLARQAGYGLECDSMVKSGVTASFHADAATEHGQAVLQAIQKGYDIVFLQDNGNCISSEEKRRASQNAYRTLGEAIHAAGARTGIYFRPPYGYETWGRDPIAQCREFDRHFGEIAQSIGSVNAYVNRAFACAIQHTDFDVWGPDHAHTSEYGAYLAVCVFFCAIFGESSAALRDNGLPPADARVLQDIADRIMLRGELPWS